MKTEWFFFVVINLMLKGGHFIGLACFILFLMPSLHAVSDVVGAPKVFPYALAFLIVVLTHFLMMILFTRKPTGSLSGKLIVRVMSVFCSERTIHRVIGGIIEDLDDRLVAIGDAGRWGEKFTVVWRARGLMLYAMVCLLISSVVRLVWLPKT